jgi:lysozyme
MLIPIVADMAHFNVVDMHKVKAAGIHGIIHKASQGLGYTDKSYAPRRELAAAAGLWWGAYDFATGDTVAANVARFVSIAKPDENTLMCLDFEDNAHSPMSGTQAMEFLDRVDQATGRACWIYGGNRLFEQVTPVAAKSSTAATFFASHPLWLCQYKTDRGLRDTDLTTLKRHLRIPPPWKFFTLLQYTGDRAGPLPHQVDGLENGADLNVFDGSAEDLQMLWAGSKKPA